MASFTYFDINAVKTVGINKFLELVGVKDYKGKGDKNGRY